MIVRNLQEGEQLPFQTGMEPLKLDPPWAWVAVEKERIVGVLLAAPCHGAVLLVRLVAAEGAPTYWVRRVLTQASKDLIRRGYYVAFVYFNIDNKQELRLAKLLMNHGKEGRRGMLADKHVMCIGAVEDWVRE